MGYYTGFKYKIKIKEEFIEFFTSLTNYEVDLSDLPVRKIPPKFLPIWLDYLKDDRKDWLVGGGSAYFDQDDWKTEFSMIDDLFYSSGSLKDYNFTIDSFTELLPLFGEEFIIITVGEDWCFGSEEEFEVVKSENCTLTFELLEE